MLWAFTTSTWAAWTWLINWSDSTGQKSDQKVVPSSLLSPGWHDGHQCMAALQTSFGSSPWINPVKASVTAWLQDPCGSGHTHGNKRRCDNGESNSPQKKRKPTVPTPAPELRYDGLHHYPEYTNERMRCKKGSCSGQTRVICSNVTFLFAFRASRTASSLTTLSSAYYSFVLDWYTILC